MALSTLMPPVQLSSVSVSDKNNSNVTNWSNANTSV